MTTLLDEVNNFPGVGEEYLLKIWEQISPDPNIILKIPETFFINRSKIKNVFKKVRIFDFMKYFLSRKFVLKK